MKQPFLSLFVVSGMQWSCHDLVSLQGDLLPVLPTFSANQLAAVPETVVVAGSHIVLSTSLYRDFMPVTTPGGSPLGGMVTLSPVRGDTLPATLTADALWVFKGTEVWSGWLHSYPGGTDPGSPVSLKYAVRDGPNWGPDIVVGVAVRLHDGKSDGILVKAEGQGIGATY